ncbi:YifB family Mg chelatase-like AAA ATPase [Deinococcus maricopensis]|uniref:Mg chelatase, subunit ChlI n=1 Tax=Deinococcus maricopensis (strain DSM 21211 / LMG 22137 / NRRL B-23946 / LB-34) TaxID=709986 RepID=E8U7B9_DEIML|nr:YifB family Mg chelatase-like AAA ATPase [Deinococcus maricopensis]ADV66958.1 Mg chelatase, subunit ChlI [Deinococcus maricopensis DSM 21211]
MLARTTSVALIGVNAVPVTVEVDVSPGLPAFAIVGLPDQALSEARERVRAAVRNSGLPFPTARITVNLAPADLRKEGPLFDLPIALGVLAAQDLLPTSALGGVLIAGELALDGSLRPVAGAVNLALRAAEVGADVLLPLANAEEAALIDGARVYGASTLRDAVAHLSGEAPLPLTTPPTPTPPEDTLLDLLDIKGQTAGKRALEIAVAGGHNLLMVGSPGSGKTMLARRAPGLLPPLTRAEALDVTRIHSAAGLLSGREGLLTTPPYRAPHHTVSDAGLIGGGSVPKPGEVSLAHRGVLFLDEFPEFSRKALETLRQPLEEGTVTISRARATVQYPARFQLLSAMNPCPCGYFGDAERPCTCTPGERARYAGRLSGPLLDRIDLVVRVPRLTVDELTRAAPGEPSAKVRGRVLRARERMLARQGERNALLQGQALQAHARLGPGPEAFVRAAARTLGLTGRSFDRVLRVARTVADLAGHPDITEAHLAAAVSYRPRDLAT